jgi:hypothetical protein
VGTLRPGTGEACCHATELGHRQTHHVRGAFPIRGRIGVSLSILCSGLHPGGGAAQTNMVPAYPCADPYCSRGESASARPVCALAGALQRLLRWLPISQRGCPYRRDGYHSPAAYSARRLEEKWRQSCRRSGDILSRSPTATRLRLRGRGRRKQPLKRRKADEPAAPDVNRLQRPIFDQCPNYCVPKPAKLSGRGHSDAERFGSMQFVG